MHLLMVGTTAPSHVYPGLAVIAELVRRGHRVTYAVGERLAPLVAPTGADVLAHRSLLPTADEHWPQDVAQARHVFLDEQVAVLPLLEEQARPDAVLYDIGGYAGRVAARRWDVPAVQLSPAYVAWDGYEEDMAEHEAAVAAGPSGRRFAAALRDWLDAHGVTDDGEAFVGRPSACVVLVPRVLQPHADRVDPDRYVFAGPCPDPSRLTGWAPPPGDDRPLVYVGLGTAYTDRPDLYRLCLQVLGEDHRVVLASGKVDPADLGPLPRGAVVARVQPQLDVLAHADLFITHAGMGGAGEALWSGVPTVAVPQAVDQFLNAETLERIGAGVRLGAIEPAALRSAVAAARACAGRVRALQGEVRTTGGPVPAADAVERLATG